MADYKYSFDVKENMAKAVGRNLQISTKYSVEICNFLRGMPLEKAKTVLSNVMLKKQAIPFRRYNHNIGHRKKLGPARYPIKASGQILDLLNTVTANAQIKGLATGKLEICHISAQKGAKIMHRGRIPRRKMKQTHIEVVVKESEKIKEKPKTEVKKAEPKPAVRKEAKQEKKAVQEKKEVKTQKIVEPKQEPKEEARK